MQLSIVICTFNRAQYLAKALQSLKEDLNNEIYEIVIVDNNCTDDSPEVGAKFKNEGLKINYVIEEKQGLSFARNKGFQVAQFPFIAYLDDDAIVSPGWICAIFNQIGRHSHHDFISGGKIEVIWEYTRPDWVGDNLLNWLGKLDLGEARKLDFPLEHVNGGNMLINKSLLVKTGGFNTSLGIQGKKMFTNEEIEFQKRAVAESASIFYDPAMLILHHARLNVTPEWFMKRANHHGISVSRTDKYRSPNLLVSIAKLILIYKDMFKLNIKKRMGKISDLVYTSEMVSHSYFLGAEKEGIKLLFSRDNNKL